MQVAEHEVVVVVVVCVCVCVCACVCGGRGGAGSQGSSNVRLLIKTTAAPSRSRFNDIRQVAIHSMDTGKCCSLCKAEPKVSALLRRAPALMRHAHGP